MESVEKLLADSGDGREVELVERRPALPAGDHVRVAEQFMLVGIDDRFRHRVVVGVADRADVGERSPGNAVCDLNRQSRDRVIPGIRAAELDAQLRANGATDRLVPAAEFPYERWRGCQHPAV